MINVPPGRPVRNSTPRTLERFHIYLLLVLGIALVGAGLTVIGFATISPAVVGIGAGTLVAAGLIAVYFALARSRLTVEEVSVPTDDISIATLREPQYHRVHSDALFCLALMRHHGAPTRLLDCTYSPFVAAAFAMEYGFAFAKRPPSIWCFRAGWCDDAAKKAVSPLKLVDLRDDDRNRTDETFIPMYQLGPSTPVHERRFVKPENPFHLNERLTTQQGVFLCPADLAVSFVCNLRAMHDWELNSNVLKLSLRLDQQKAIEFAWHLKLMNLSSAALFPGLDGFARSIGQQIFHYQELADDEAGHRQC